MSSFGDRYQQHSLSSASSDAALLSDLRSSCKAGCYIDKALAACFLQVGDVAADETTQVQAPGAATASTLLPFKSSRAFHPFDGLVDAEDIGRVPPAAVTLASAAATLNQTPPNGESQRLHHMDFQGFPVMPQDDATHQALSNAVAISSRSPATPHQQRKGSKQAASKQSAAGRSVTGKIASDSNKRSSSSFRGVTRHRWTGRFEAHLWDSSVLRVRKNNKGRRKGKQVYLGGYASEEAAARAYDRAALRFWGKSAAINFVAEDYAGEMEDIMSMTKETMISSLRRLSTGFSRGASKYRGVTKHHMHGKWEARIGRVAGNRYLYLGTFSSEVEAARAYDKAAVQYRGEKAVTNFNVADYKDLSNVHSNVIGDILPAVTETNHLNPAETTPVPPALAHTAALLSMYSPSIDVNVQFCASLLAILEDCATHEFFIPQTDLISPKSDASANSSADFLDHMLP